MRKSNGKDGKVNKASFDCPIAQLLIFLTNDVKATHPLFLERSLNHPKAKRVFVNTW